MSFHCNVHMLSVRCLFVHKLLRRLDCYHSALCIVIVHAKVVYIEHYFCCSIIKRVSYQFK